MGMLTDGNPRPTIVCDPGKGAQQSFKEECDINNILKKYVKTGLLTHVAQNEGRYADISEVGSYHDAVTRVIETRKFFAGLPPELRLEFGNDPAVFLDFMADPANEDEIRRLDLGDLIEEVLPPPEPLTAPEEPPEAPDEDA